MQCLPLTSRNHDATRFVHISGRKGKHDAPAASSEG
jgi:hypothetical protein